MKLRNALLLGTSMMIMAASAVSAEEAVTEVPEEVEESAGGLLGALFGEGGLLSGALPEGIDIDSKIDSAKEHLSKANEEFSEAAQDIGDIVQGALEELDLDAGQLKEYAEMFIGSLAGGDDGGFSVAEKAFEQTKKIREAEEAVIRDHNADLLDFGEVQIISISDIYTDDYDKEEVKKLAYILQRNYTMGEENELKFLNSAEDVALFRHQPEENGDFPVTDVIFAGDGEDYAAAIEELCGEVGITADECMDSIAFGEVLFISDLIEYMDAHPEITGAEYDGEIRTTEELWDIWIEKAVELEPETEALTE